MGNAIIGDVSTPADVLAQLLALPDEAARQAFLDAYAPAWDDATANAVADALKVQADHFLRAHLETCWQFTRLLFYLAALRYDEFIRALGLRAEGNVLSIGQGQHREAVEKYNAAAEIYRASGRELDAAKAQVGKIFALTNLGQTQAALVCGEAVLQVLEEHQEWQQLATTAMNIGVIYGRLGNDQKALHYFDHAKQTYLKVDSSDVSLVEMNRIESLRNLGKFETAVQAGEQAFNQLHTEGRQMAAANALRAISTTRFLQGRHNEAMQLLEQARATFFADDRTEEVAITDLIASDCHLQLRHFDEVIEKSRSAKQIFAKIGDHFEAAQGCLNESLALAGLGRDEEAIASLAEAKALFQAAANPVWTATTELETARLLQRRKDCAAALHIALACAKLFQARSLPVKHAQAELVAAQASLGLGQHQTAQHHAHRTLAIAIEKNLPWLAHPAHAVLAKLSQQTGDAQQALNHFEQAIQNIETMRGQMMVEFRASFLEDKAALYEEAVALCLSMGDAPLALRYAERAKSRALLDLLAQRLDIGIHPRQPADESLVKQLVHARAERDRLLRRVQGQAHENRAEASSTSSPPSDDDQTFVEAQQRIAELERTITDDWHKLLVRNADYARDAALWQVQVSSPQPHLAVGQVLVEYFALQDDLLLFCITPHHITTHRAPHGMAQAQTLLRNLWLNTNAVVHSPPQHLDALTRNAQAILEQLHALLLQPIAEHIPPATQLIIVPHGPLHYLPFHALTDGAHYLIEQHEVSYLPASSALAHLAQPVVAQGPLRCTAFGHTRGGLLPLAVDETRSVAAQMGGRSFVEAEATLAQLRAAAANSDVLHLAMHGNFRADNALFSGLQLDDGTLTTLDIFGLKLRAALVTLSACQTGRNVVSGGDELLGLARAFFSAGAATLLLSLWRVEDVATTELMQTFYAQLRAGATKAAALRAAQRALLSQQRHPFFWAPFFLMGDGGQLPAASH